MFGRTLRLLPFFMCANSEGSGETARLRRFAWAFTGRICDKYHSLMSWLISSLNNHFCSRSVPTHTDDTYGAICALQHAADKSQKFVFIFGLIGVNYKKSGNPWSVCPVKRECIDKTAPLCSNSWCIWTLLWTYQQTFFLFFLFFFCIM